MTAYLPCFFYEMNGLLLDIKPTDGRPGGQKFIKNTLMEEMRQKKYKSLMEAM